MRIVVPVAAGGGVDLSARAMSPDLAKRLGQTVLVENKPGGSTNIGSDFVAKSAPDGYTLLMAAPSNAVNPSLFKQMPYDTRRDLMPVTDVIGGHVQFMFTNLLAALPQIRAGKVRPLAVTDIQRPSALPDVPTFAEAGYPDMQVTVWWGLMAPAGTPPAVIARLNREVAATVSGAEFRKYMEEMGGRVVGGTPEEFGYFLDAKISRWAKVVQASGVKPE